MKLLTLINKNLIDLFGCTLRIKQDRFIALNNIKKNEGMESKCDSPRMSYKEV